MDSALGKQFLLLASFATLLLLGTSYARGATTRCFFGPYRGVGQYPKFRALRDKYEDLGSQDNCSSLHLKAQWTLKNLTKPEKLEAVKMEVSLTIRVLQGQNEPTLSKAISEVLPTLQSLQEVIEDCLRTQPSNHKASGYFQTFKEQFQKFNSSNAEISPRCLERAVGLNVVRLLHEDVHLLAHPRRHRHHPSA